MTDRVDPSMRGLQPPGAQPVLDLVTTKSESRQLRSRDYSVLPSC
jgi:hypothetical protein